MLPGFINKETSSLHMPLTSIQLDKFHQKQASTLIKNPDVCQLSLRGHIQIPCLEDNRDYNCSPKKTVNVSTLKKLLPEGLASKQPETGLPRWLRGKNLPTKQEMQVQSLGWDDSPGETNGWEIPQTEEPGRLQSMVLQKVGQNLVTKQQQQMC